MSKPEQKVLITGATSGVGLSLVRHLQSQYHVVALGRSGDKLKTLFGNDDRVDCYVANFERTDSVSAILDNVLTEHPIVLNVINNAGAMLNASITTLNATDLQSLLSVNTIAAHVVMKKCLPAMLTSNFGRIINVTSGAAFNCFPNFAAYSASKAALNALTLTASAEHCDSNIKINLMSPGPVRSQMAPDAPLDPSVCHPTVDYLLSADESLPTGGFFWLGHKLATSPDFSGIDWLAGTAPPRIPYVLDDKD